jgi:hypothetical protein
MFVDELRMFRCTHSFTSIMQRKKIATKVASVKSLLLLAAHAICTFEEHSGSCEYSINIF